MSAWQWALLVAALSATFGLLLHFARVSREDRRRKDDKRERQVQRTREERDGRIQRVVDNYTRFVDRGESSNLRGMVRAGVTALQEHGEVVEACRRIDELGLTPAIPPCYRSDLEGKDLLKFFCVLAANERALQFDGETRKAIEVTPRHEVRNQEPK
jgi:hypothetical protein